MAKWTYGGRVRKLACCRSHNNTSSPFWCCLQGWGDKWQNGVHQACPPISREDLRSTELHTKGSAACQSRMLVEFCQSWNEWCTYVRSEWEIKSRHTDLQDLLYFVQTFPILISQSCWSPRYVHSRWPTLAYRCHWPKSFVGHCKKQTDWLQIDFHQGFHRYRNIRTCLLKHTTLLDHLAVWSPTGIVSEGNVQG